MMLVVIVRDPMNYQRSQLVNLPTTVMPAVLPTLNAELYCGDTG